MNNFCENCNIDCSSTNLIEIEKKYLETNISSNFINNVKIDNNRNNYIYFSINSNKTINNEHQNYCFDDSERINKFFQPKDIQKQNNQINKINIEKNKINKKASFDSSKENKNIKSINLIEEQNKNGCPKALSNDKTNKNMFDSLSEIKKFKTELCHSWELTGTCKYGQNVNIKIYNDIS